MKRLAAHSANLAYVLACAPSMVVPALPWMSGEAQYAILIAVFALGVGLQRIAGPEWASQTNLEARIARNHKFWEEYERVRDDPHLKANPEKWPECLLKDYLNDPVYKARVQELIGW